MSGYFVEVTEYSLERGNIRRSLHGRFAEGQRQPIDYAVAAHRAHMLNAFQGLMFLHGPRSYTLTARVVAAPQFRDLAATDQVSRAA